MTRNLRPAMFGAMLPLLLGSGRPAEARGVIDPPVEGRIWVGGTSSVRGWECKAMTFDLKVDTEQGAPTAVLSGNKAVTAVALTIPTEKLECGNGTMNGHAKKALKVEEHANIEFRLASYELVPSNDSMTVTMKGALTLGGTAKDIELVALARAGTDGTMRVTGTYEFKMTDFGLKPPTMMFGRMKVGDLVKVGFDIVLRDRTS